MLLVATVTVRLAAAVRRATALVPSGTATVRSATGDGVPRGAGIVTTRAGLLAAMVRVVRIVRVVMVIVRSVRIVLP